MDRLLSRSLFHFKIIVEEQFIMMTWLPHVLLLFVLPTWLIYGISRFLFYRKYKLRIMIELTILGYITYFIILFYVVWMTPTLLLEYLPINLIPFKTIFQYFVEVSTGTLAFSTAFINIAGNILLTVPIGFLIYIIYRRVSFNKLLLIALMFPLVIETGQLVLHLVDISTRTIDIDDLILNALGIVIGYYLLYLIQLFIKVKNT